MLSETRGNSGREREVGARLGGAEAKGTGVQKVRRQRREGHFEHDRTAGSGITTSATTRRRSAETEEGIEHSSSPTDGEISQLGAANSPTATAR